MTQSEMKLGETHIEWICKNCDDEPHLLMDEFKEHLQEIHDIDPKTKGTQKMLLHLDETEYARSTYEWTIGGLKFLQLTLYRRAADDMMRWA